MINSVSVILPNIEAKPEVSNYIYNGATLKFENYLELLKMAGVSGTFDIENCVNHTFYAETTCEKGHVSNHYRSCGDEVFCPRCNQRNILERKDKIMSKFEYFKWNNIGKFVFTVPEEYRKTVFEDHKKFYEVVRNTLNGFFEGVVGGFSIPHVYSTEQPWVINPHVEVYISDLVLLNRKYKGVRKTVCRFNKKTGKTQKYDPEKHISFKEDWDKRHNHSSYADRKPRELIGNFKRLKNMYLSPKALSWLKTLYSILFNNAFGGNIVDLNVNYCYYKKKNEKSINKLMYHAIPYGLKMPLNPEAVKDVSSEGIITYITVRNGEDVVVMDTLDNVKKVFELGYYNKSNSKRFSWFGYMSDGVWRDYARLLTGEFPELVKKKAFKDDIRFCSVCGENVIHVKTNCFAFVQRCVDYDIKYEFMEDDKHG